MLKPRLMKRYRDFTRHIWSIFMPQNRCLVLFFVILLYFSSGCHLKCHKDHVDRKEDCIQECEG